MSLRFTVSKSDGDRCASDIQGEVNQLFEGDEPDQATTTTNATASPSSSSAPDREDAAGPEAVVVLKGRLWNCSRLYSRDASCCWLAMSYTRTVCLLANSP